MDKNEVIACTLLPRDIGQKALVFLLPCQSIDVLYCVLKSLFRTERNETERNGMEWNKQIDINGVSIEIY